MNEAECGCITCQDKRRQKLAEDGLELLGPDKLFRYACEICGNKRCPHHTNHILECSNSNEPGQPGSCYPNLWK